MAPLLSPERMKLLIPVLLLCLSVSRSDADPQKEQEKGKIICSQGPVKVKQGEDVTLDFHLEPQRDVTDKLVEWKFNKTTHVLVYRSRGFSEDQAEQFRGRAHLGSSGDLSKGKIPVKISNITKDDAGEYSCSVVKEKISCSVRLMIESAKDKSVVGGNRGSMPTPKPPEDHQGIYIGVGGVAIAVIAAIIAGVLWWKCKNNTQQEPNTGHGMGGNRNRRRRNS